MNRITFHLLLLVLMVTSSCEKEEDISRPQVTPSLANDTSSSISQLTTGSRMDKVTALYYLNLFWGDKLSPIEEDQVRGVAKKKFEEWLDNSKISSAKPLVKEVLKAPGTKCLLIHNVTFLPDNKPVTVGILSPSKELLGKYTQVITLIEYSRKGSFKKELCMWRHCAPPSQLSCFTYIKPIPKSSSCPNDCNNANCTPERVKSIGGGTSIGLALDKTIEAFQEDQD